MSNCNCAECQSEFCENDLTDALESATDLEEKLEIIQGFSRLPEPENEDTQGYVADHWAQAIHIVDQTDGKTVLFTVDMMVIFKADFPMAEEIKAKIHGIFSTMVL